MAEATIPQSPMDSERFKTLPPQIRLEDTVETKEAEPARDPEQGRNTDQEFMLRYAG